MNHVTPEYEAEVRTLLRRLMAHERAERRKVMAEVEAEIQAEEADAFKLPRSSGTPRDSAPWIDNIIANAMRN